MISHRPVLPFPARLPKRAPAKAVLRGDVQSSVERSIQKLPALGRRNPDAALLIERSIDDWMPAGPSGGCEAWTLPKGPGLDLEQPHFLLTRELTVFMVSDTLEQALGMGQREFRRHWREHLEAADTDALQRDFHEAVITREGFSERVHWRMADGTLQGSLLRVTPRRLHGQSVGFTGVLIFDRAA